MSATTESIRRPETYALGHTTLEWERLRAQARDWETATVRILGQLTLPEDASCLDAGCGPGETTRLLAQRVGPGGRVLGIDVDADIGAVALEMLHGGGYRRCAFRAHDLAADEPVPGGPFDLVYARLLLIHLPDRAAALARLWDAVAPGGYLVVQDYDASAFGVVADLPSFAELTRVILDTFRATGADVRTGALLPQLFVQAGVGCPDGTDVAGHVEPLGRGGRTYAVNVYRSLLPAALAHGITTEYESAALLAELAQDTALFASSPVLWPLLIGAWKRKGLPDPPEESASRPCGRASVIVPPFGHR
ncbi:MAG TPA: methyltransferase domain-containing protein [Trebonia sp.]|nr:methyltransferase domain-containing protein [Trebonia sp.]